MQVLDVAGVVPGSVAVRAADGSATFVEGQDYTVSAAEGMVSAIVFDEATLPTTTVDIAYVPQPVTRDSTAAFTVDIPSAARPAAPKPRYALPTFAWSMPDAGPTAFSSERKGGGLRVYLDRPWWSSGEGELLGVVLYRPPLLGAAPPDRLKPCGTRWGIDPLFESASIASTPSLDAFPLSKPEQRGQALLLDELPELVDVAGHEVGYDDDRQLRYCDIESDAGASYLPFVRLALARYQPSSVSGAHLSRVVLSDFVQLTPDRNAGITRDAGEV